MTEFFKNIKSQAFEFLLILLIPLALYRVVFTTKYGELIKLIKDNLKGIDLLLEFVFYSLLFYSIVTTIIYIFIMLIKKPIELIFEYRFKHTEDRALGLLKTYNKFFYGSLDRVSFLFRWMMLVAGYLYQFNQGAVINFWSDIYIYYSSLNGFIKFLMVIPTSIFGLIIAISLYGSFQMTAFQYLYLKRKNLKVDSQEA